MVVGVAAHSDSLGVDISEGGWHMKHIVNRTTTDDFHAWEWADEAARHGWRVVAVICRQKPFEPDRWNVWAEAPLDAKPDDWDRWVDERRAAKR